MIRTHQITLPIWKQKINLISGDRKECLEYLNDLYHEHLDIQFAETCDAITYVIKNDLWIYFDFDLVTIPILSHELIHATYTIFQDFGLDLHDEEAFAYIHQYLLEELIPYFVKNIEYGSY